MEPNKIRFRALPVIVVNSENSESIATRKNTFARTYTLAISTPNILFFTSIWTNTTKAGIRNKGLKLNGGVYEANTRINIKKASGRMLR